MAALLHRVLIHQHKDVDDAGKKDPAEHDPLPSSTCRFGSLPSQFLVVRKRKLFLILLSPYTLEICGFDSSSNKV
jgi:hypothetical protein